jgi:glucose-6-phosphate isomerase
MEKITFDYTKALKFIGETEMNEMEQSVMDAHQQLNDGTGLGNDYIGWLRWPVNYDKEEYERIKKCASKIRRESDVFIVIGIGGSYLGARAAIEMLSSPFDALNNKKPLIIYAGNSLSSTYLAELLSFIKDKDVSINVISKSGTTTEPAIAFRFLKSFLETKYGKNEAKERIYVTTDASKGTLKSLAMKEGYESFVIPDNIGGRYSVLTPVGLLPMAVSGIDIDMVMKGANDAMLEYSNNTVSNNQCYQYATIRNILYGKGKKVELITTYEPRLQFFSEWWKQLYGESEGKMLKGLFPASVTYSTDLHSMGQYVQDGERIIFETVLQVGKPNQDLLLTKVEGDIDGLNFLDGQNVSYVNNKAFEGTLLAHTDGSVPNLVINIPCLNEYYLGYLVYFFEKACAISGYLLGVNPFDQPGVEAYKKNMFALLGKPGFEQLKSELETKLNSNK